tara:strand:+ start:9482 stop:10117 length:636 start_codon:yes stop_codon:yes gene_type:complete
MTDNNLNDASQTKNIVWHSASVDRELRIAKQGHKSAILWFTGLSGSGKSTLANAVNLKLFDLGCSSFVLDGDNIRHGLCKDLGFSDQDREENIRRISEVAKLFVESGLITLTAFVSPFKSDRNTARAIVKPGDFIEIYCSASLETCENRDVKGLYAKAREGKILDFTGISSPYESPDNPEIVIDSSKETVEESVNVVMQYLQSQQVINLKT